MNKNRLMGLALAGVLALSVAGCGGGDEAKPAGSAPADASADYKVQMVTEEDTAQLCAHFASDNSTQERKNMKKNRLMGLALAGVLALSVAGCGGGDEAKPAGSAPADASADYKVQMVTDMGGVNDQSFNQLAWEGLQQLNKDTGIEVGYTESKQESDYATNLDKAVDDGVNDQSFNQLAWEGLQQLNKDTGIEVGYTESKQESDYATNLDKAVDDGAQTVWGIGFAMAGAIRDAAAVNPDVHFAIIDNAYPEKGHKDDKGNEDGLLDNLTGVTFKTRSPTTPPTWTRPSTTAPRPCGASASPWPRRSRTPPRPTLTCTSPSSTTPTPRPTCSITSLA